MADEPEKPRKRRRLRFTCQCKGVYIASSYDWAGASAELGERGWQIRKIIYWVLLCPPCAGKAAEQPDAAA